MRSGAREPARPSSAAGAFPADQAAGPARVELYRIRRRLCCEPRHGSANRPRRSSKNASMRLLLHGLARRVRRPLGQRRASTWTLDMPKWGLPLADGVVGQVGPAHKRRRHRRRHSAVGAALPCPRPRRSYPCCAAWANRPLLPMVTASITYGYSLRYIRLQVGEMLCGVGDKVKADEPVVIIETDKARPGCNRV